MAFQEVFWEESQYCLVSACAVSLENDYNVIFYRVMVSDVSANIFICIKYIIHTHTHIYINI